MWLRPLQSFQLDYDHHSTVAFGNARITLWRKNVLCFCLNAVANLEVILVCNELCCGMIWKRHCSLSLILPYAWSLCFNIVPSYVIFQSSWFSFVQTQLHFICLTGNFRKGVVRSNLVAKWVAAWKRLKTTGLTKQLNKTMPSDSTTTVSSSVEDRKYSYIIKTKKFHFLLCAAPLVYFVN